MDKFTHALMIAASQPIPCKECGEMRIDLIEPKRADGRFEARIRCVVCGHLGPMVEDDIQKRTRHRAIIAWNFGYVTPCVK